MKNINLKNELFKSFCLFKEKGNLEYLEALDILLDFLKGAITGFMEGKNLPYEHEVKEVMRAYLNMVKVNPYGDHLGDLFQSITKEFGKTANAQHFTPSYVSDLIVALMNRSIGQRVFEPCCGFGAIALAWLKGNPGSEIKMDLNDIDPRCCRATFIQVHLCILMTNQSNAPCKVNITCGDVPKGKLEPAYLIGNFDRA
jgi:hypothetical protein